MSEEPRNKDLARRKYEKAFKEEVVRQWMSSGLAARVIAKQYGIPVSMLHQWKHYQNPPPGVEKQAAKESLADEVVRLRAEVARLTEQREILKKAAGILCEPPLRGMPGSKL